MHITVWHILFIITTFVLLTIRYRKTLYYDGLPLVYSILLIPLDVLKISVDL